MWSGCGVSVGGGGCFYIRNILLYVLLFCWSNNVNFMLLDRDLPQLHLFGGYLISTVLGGPHHLVR